MNQFQSFDKSVGMFDHFKLLAHSLCYLLVWYGVVSVLCRFEFGYGELKDLYKVNGGRQ